MKCANCNAEVQLRQEHCPVCGQRVTVDFDVLAQSVHEDAAVERGQKIGAALRWLLLSTLIAGALIYGVNDLYDKPLIYDGAGMAALPGPANTTIDIETLQKPYLDPRPDPALPQAKSTAFGYRFSPIKERIRSASKGDVPAERVKSIPSAISEGLKFLAAHQTADGSWTGYVVPREWDQLRTKEHTWGQTGICGLVVLAFLGEGEIWIKDPKTQRPSLYAEKVRKGLRYIAQQQDADGRFGAGEGETVHFMYNQGICTLAMCEAAGLSGDEQLREIAQKALNYIVKSQTPEGGWNYRGAVEGDSDTSVTAWVVQALLAGKEAGLKIPDECMNKAAEMYKNATAPDGRVMYSLKNDDKQDRPSLTGVALMLRQLQGEDPRSPSIRKLSDKLRDQLPSSKPTWGRDWKPNMPKNDDETRAAYDPYKIYFCTYGMYFIGGKDWENWNEAMKKAVCEMQSADGSWKCNDVWSTCGGTLYSTALSILTLQVYYRIQ